MLFQKSATTEQTVHGGLKHKWFCLSVPGSGSPEATHSQCSVLWNILHSPWSFAIIFVVPKYTEASIYSLLLFTGCFHCILVISRYSLYKNTYANEVILIYYIFKAPISRQDCIHMWVSWIKTSIYVLENTIQPITEGCQHLTCSRYPLSELTNPSSHQRAEGLYSSFLLIGA